MESSKIKISILAGGESSRLQRDKRFLRVSDGSYLIDRMVSLALGICDKVEVLAKDEINLEKKQVFIRDDLESERGLLGLIYNIICDDASVEHLVLSVDLYKLDTVTLKKLCKSHSENFLASFYKNEYVQPLCAIYSQKSIDEMKIALAEGISCPRKFLKMISSKCNTLELGGGDELFNLNSPSDLFNLNDSNKSVRVLLFGELSEKLGRDDFLIKTKSKDCRELFIEHFHKNPEFVKVAIDEKFVGWGAPLQDGDTVAFLPPMCGG